MITFYIYLGILGGILVAISIAGYRIESSKINQERFENSKDQRKELNENISKSHNNITKQINESDTKILNKLNDVGNKVNNIYASDKSNINDISIPKTGSFGQNILDKDLLEISSGTYSMKAILPKNELVKVKISGDNWAYNVNQPIGGWDSSDFDNKDKSRIFTTIKYGIADYKFRLEKGETEILLFFGKSQIPEWKKVIKVN
ncbi:MAG: hypothetical protein ABFR05_02410 [Bacteroidota bacterium]